MLTEKGVLSKPEILESVKKLQSETKVAGKDPSKHSQRTRMCGHPALLRAGSWAAEDHMPDVDLYLVRG